MTDHQLAQGFLLRVRLAKLHQQFRVTRDAVVIKQSPPCDGPQLLSGYAITFDTDLDRQRFEKNSLTWPETPKLLFRHLPDQVAGEVLGLRWTAKGLWVTARVDHVEARRCNAFSVGVDIHAAEIIDQTSASFVGSITKGILREVSMVVTPANQFALVEERKTYKPSPMSQWTELMKDRVTVLQKIVSVMQTQIKRPPPEPPRRQPPPPRRPSTGSQEPVGKRGGPFSELVNHLNHERR